MRTENKDFMIFLLEIGDQVCGTVDDIGYHARIDGPVVADCDWINSRECYPNITVELAYELASMAGCIILQNSDGFVYWEIYQDQSELNRVWSGIEAQYAEFYGEEN